MISSSIPVRRTDEAITELCRGFGEYQRCRRAVYLTPHDSAKQDQYGAACNDLIVAMQQLRKAFRGMQHSRCLKGGALRKGGYDEEKADSGTGGAARVVEGSGKRGVG